jgi:hypothetical protein
MARRKLPESCWDLHQVWVTADHSMKFLVQVFFVLNDFATSLLLLMPELLLQLVMYVAHEP